MTRIAVERTDLQTARRRLSQGAEVTAEGTHFRVWAPGHRSVELVLAGAATPVPLIAETGDGGAGRGRGPPGRLGPWR